MNKGETKTGDDYLYDDDISELEASIKDAIISEYLVTNNISEEEFVWPDKDDAAWNYLIKTIEYFSITLETDVEMPVEEPANQSEEIMKAAFVGITNWLDTQGSYDSGYFLIQWKH